MKQLKALIPVALLSVAAFATPPAESPYAIPQPPFYGQVRTRTEFDHKAMLDTSINRTLISTQLRTRLGFVATPSEKVEIKVEFQDVRFMGSEPNTLPTSPTTAVTASQTASTGNRAGVDLLQGYVAVQEGPVKTVLGRQKMSLGAGRYLSTLEWSPYSRSFDGVSTNWSQGPGDLTAFYYMVRDTSTFLVSLPVTNNRLALMGLNYDYKFNDNLTANAGLFYDQSRLRNIYSGSALERYDLFYYDERVQGKFGFLTFEEEFIWQGGKGKDTSAAYNTIKSSAFQLATRVGVAFPRVKANIGLDIMSGDSNTTDKKTTMYRANYYFAHAYYGWMDYFVTNPAFGVMDYRADVDAILWEKENRSISFKGQYHYFTPQQASKAADDAYGQEIDAEFHLALYPKSNIVLGAALFMADKDAFKLGAAKLPSATAKDKSGFFFYFMPVFNF